MFKHQFLSQSLLIKQITNDYIVRFTLTVVNDFCRFLRQLSTSFYEITHTLFSIPVVTTLKIWRSYDKYLRS